ncbi:zinc ribbon domain-containing protein [Caballeronia sp. DA-9]|uniref:zinc ribbon domain-containing protein n=1 Tax=Caballeronia sp. DA-9 TaxID=3436237 RepID=UPI003F671593
MRERASARLLITTPKMGPSRRVNPGFSAMRRIAERDDASNCQSCGNAARRTLGSPALSLMVATQRCAHQVNERASNTPHRHGPGCGSGRGSNPKLAVASKQGLKSNEGGRPRMISH